MKTTSHLKNLNIEVNWPRAFSARWHAQLMLLHSVFLIALALMSGAALAAAPNFCQQTAQDALRSCTDGAESDYQLALGNCDNLPDAAGRTGCEKQAAADFKSALQLCGQQNTLRQIVCGKLGPAPYDPNIVPSNFVAVIDNPFFPLKPGTTFIYEGQTAEGFEHVEFAVTHQTKVILGVTCTEIHDTRRVNGIVLEDTRDWFAQDKQGNVWYFGENTTLVADGLPVDLTGSWTGGVDGAKPGIIMKAHPHIGDFYRQEFSLGNAEDLAEVKSLSAHATVPFGSFNNCLKTLESSSLAPGDLEHKFYAAGVGNLLTVDLATGEREELVKIITE